MLCPMEFLWEKCTLYGIIKKNGAKGIVYKGEGAMRFQDYSGPEQFRPLNAWEYFGYAILYMVPVIGWIFLLIFTFSTSNYNRRSFTRSYWCGLILILIAVTFMALLGIGAGGWHYASQAVR